ncbi:MAG: hypothetical protein IJ833_02530 [Lachnospiraceae bacterium]|nr:hypothetical protein [Lachnospiraceae bacterium]
MADIRTYFKEKEKREQNQSTYKDKIMRHKLANFYRIALIAVVLMAVIALIVVQYKRHIYTGYDIVTTVERDKASESVDVRLGNAILTYSKDGAHCTDSKGNVSWNQTYQMQDIKVATCQDVAAIGNYNGREIYVANTSEQLGTIATTMPIRNMAVAANGNVTAILADTDITWINTYSPQGELLYYGQTHMSNSGYPVAISLSPNGELLAVSYIYVDAGVIKTNIAFYNFGPVGANQSDYVVGVQAYTDLLVPHIQFMNNETAFAVGDSRLMIYKGSQKPVSAAEYLYNDQVQSVFFSEKYIGLVFLSDDMENRYRINVYDVNAQEVGSYYFDIEYDDIIFTADNMVIYNQTECVILTYDGVEKFHGNFSKTVNQVLPVGNSYKYLMVTDNSIDTIQLK